MPLVSNHDLVQAKRIASSSSALGSAALEFRNAIKFVLDRAGTSQGIVFTLTESRTDVVLNFGLSTVHGPVEAIYDQVLKDDDLLGRYRFFSVNKDATGHDVASEFWSILFDANGRATWDAGGDFEWSFAGHRETTPQEVGTFLLMMLVMLQDKLPKF